jgi:hypothetical protein
LPYEYQKVEYIEATGNQYIDTNYVPTMNTKIDAEFQFSSGNNSSVPLIGARMGAGNINRFLPLAMSGTNAMRITLGNSEKTFSSVSYTTKYHVIFDVKNNSYTLNDSAITVLDKSQ